MEFVYFLAEIKKKKKTTGWKLLSTCKFYDWKTSGFLCLTFICCAFLYLLIVLELQLSAGIQH